MHVVFEPCQVALPDGDLLTITELPAEETAIQAFLRTQQLGHIAAHAGKPCFETIDGERQERLMTTAEADAIYDPVDNTQIVELHNITSGRYSMSTVRNQLLLQAKLTANGREQDAACLNGIYGGWVCRVGGEAYALNTLELHVRPDYHSKWIGAALASAWFNAVIEPGPFAETVLYNSTHNYKARAWYERLGLLSTGHIECRLLPKLDVRVELEERTASVLAVQRRLQSAYNFRFQPL